MCNLYSINADQTALRALFDVDVDNLGNRQAQPGVFPDYAAPIALRANNNETSSPREVCLTWALDWR